MLLRNLMAVCLLCLMTVCLLYLPLAYGNDYKKGVFRCTDFQRAKMNYDQTPDLRHREGAYARCLLARGGEDGKALRLLESAINKGSVPSASTYALYIASGGTLEFGNFEPANYDEAYAAYAKVLHLITSDPDYPDKFIISEEAEQHELEAYQALAVISYLKFNKGLIGSHAHHILASPSATLEDKEKWGRNLYPQYKDYTLDSLHKAIENAETCTSLPMKWHYNPSYYSKVTRACAVIQDVSERYLVVEEERLTLLNDPLCSGDIELCSQYEEIFDKELVPLAREKQRRTKEIWESN